MRVLFSSTAGTGHFGPMAPFVRSCLRSGHDVLVTGPDALTSTAEATGAAFRRVDDPPADAVRAAYELLATLPHDEANAFMCAEIFGRLRPRAALPRLADTIADWRPDVVVRESAEFAAAVAAELHDVPHTRIAIGLAVMEELVLRYAAGNLDGLRRTSGLPPDPDAARLRASPYLTLFPAGLEDPSIPDPPRTRRFRDPAWAPPGEGTGRPFVYATFGSVTGAMPGAAPVFSETLTAVAGLDADVLLTVGHGLDPAALGEPPPNVRVERWVDQNTVLGRASAVVCHGGGGSMLGALAAGVPLVVAPLFAEDQHLNARRVAEAGAGVRATPDAASLRAALDTVLTTPAYRTRARKLAAELARTPTTDAAFR
ncbi:glycosyltransferase [Prauserella flavalba]|uniref:Glycosyltransferase n=1 Tax=Prauserella flavalba TaxID=1477506 RepID=A0A318LBL7_9PSEU|nr:glycosyltransferase [Prauserella flavalba]PXY16859.1 hypothetical protein BA062_38165 [Prauserella flavalba]